MSVSDCREGTWLLIIVVKEHECKWLLWRNMIVSDCYEGTWLLLIVVKEHDC
jgi:hypothetical protein